MGVTTLVPRAVEIASLVKALGGTKGAAGYLKISRRAMTYYLSGERELPGDLLETLRLLAGALLRPLAEWDV